MSWAQTFHRRRYFNMRKYFMGANISWAQTFHGREYFGMFFGSKYFCVNYYFRQAPIFNDFCSEFCLVLQWVLSHLAIGFCFDFAANICVYFQYLFMHVLCANIFGANVLKSRFKIDVVIMIICSIVIVPLTSACSTC